MAKRLILIVHWKRNISLAVFLVGKSAVMIDNKIGYSGQASVLTVLPVGHVECLVYQEEDGNMLHHCRVLDAAARVKSNPDELMRATCSIHILVRKCEEADGGRCEHLLYSQ